ncbi:methyl-accepting chemotaxis protein [Alteromonas pelagimontana]|uniref:Methyl-accepting chemotaxis protein n=1 Tax=Alteromonas pelagimontana TaxID=1858656 RepID=A0A6M4MCE6_9ALTE|nr:methyl-accepting chemotaxis protein [Alteromonas pelagimontana]QJR80719.1 methyl-accepting chemotaxis protein [Alteromonas pelagimontana]
MKLNILRKLQILALIIVVIFSAAILVMRSANNDVANQFTRFHQEDFQAFLNFEEVKGVQVDTTLSIRGLQIAYLLGLNDQIREYRSAIQTNNRTTPQLINALKNAAATDNMERLRELEALVLDFQKKAMRFVNAMDSAADNKAPFDVFKAFVDSYDALSAFFIEYEQYLNESANATQENINEAISSADMVFYIGMILALLISAALSQYIANGINRGIQALKDTALRLADGDLLTRAQIESHDELLELGEALNLTIERLRRTITTIQSSSEVVTANSNTVMQYNGEVKASADEITSNTNQAAAAIEEMSLTSQNIAENINNTAVAAEEINRVATACLSASNESVAEIDTLLASFTATVTTVEQLKAQTDSINRILEVIKAIAGQTNLLALNAAIEAARAGEQGRGFAVVADEVRQLAQRSHNSVSEIETLLSNLVAAGDSASSQMEQSNAIANNLNQRIEVSNELMAEIQTKVSGVNHQAQEIASAAEEQSSVVLEISKNMHSIKLLVDKNPETVNTSNKKSEEMKQSANQVNKQLMTFRLQ